MTKTCCWIAIAATIPLWACNPPPKCNPDEEICDTDAGPPEDICNSKDEALSDSRCEIIVGSDAGVLGYLSKAQDQDWYVAKLGTLDNRSLVHITAGYGAPATPVNLAVSVLKEDAVTGLARKIDKHGAAAPKPVDIIFPFAESNTKLFIVLADEQASNKDIFDVKNQYQAKVEIVQNPDLNEPNDMTPTVIPLTASGALMVGQGKGALATDNDVDKFSFTAPAGRKVLYLHITAPKLTPQALMRLSYTLYDSTGKSISEGTAQNEFVPVDLATARLTTAGDYTLDIRGYKPASSAVTVPGDLRLLYTVDVQFMDDLDMNEPNDSITAPKVVPLNYGGGASFTGRLGYVPDPDVFGIDLAATGNAGVLHYRLTMATGGPAPRFPALAPASDRQLRVVTQVTGSTLPQNRQDCKTNNAICPKGYEGNAGNQQLVEGLCDTQDPPWCLRSERLEHQKFPNLKNMEGRIPVPAHAGTVRYTLFVQDEGNNYADDRDYNILIEYEADPDDTTRASLPLQTQTSALVENASFPVPVGAGVSGNVSHGYGRILRNRDDEGDGVRSPNDYDAVPTDFDRFEFTLPAVAPPSDRSWALQWEVWHGDGGQNAPPSDLTLEVNFCTVGTLPDGGCMGLTRILAYSPDTLGPWYSGAQIDRGVLWQRTVGANTTTVTAQPLGCFCMEPRFMSSGHFIVNVGAVDRNRNEPTYYTIKQSLAPYPPPAFIVDGGSVSCPVVADGGASCRFTNMP